MGSSRARRLVSRAASRPAKKCWARQPGRWCRPSASWWRRHGCPSCCARCAPSSSAWTSWPPGSTTRRGARVIETIHPTALVDPRARLGARVHIGAYTVVGPDVSLDDDVELGHHVVLEGRVRLEAGVRIGHGSVIGGVPQDLKFKPETPSGVRIGARTVLREHVTVHRATAAEGWTEIGSDT